MTLARLIYLPGTLHERVFPFRHEVVIGRAEVGDDNDRTVVSIGDKSVSSRHCSIRQESEGLFVIRDTSRNGTRVDGRRLVPYADAALAPGARIEVAEGHEFLLEAVDGHATTTHRPDLSTTLIATRQSDVTIVVGDITGYTRLNQLLPPAELYPSISRVMRAVHRTIEGHGGFVKEYQGDAILAFWEHTSDGTRAAKNACAAAEALNLQVSELGEDPDIWSIAGFPLFMQWALTTGSVLLSRIGGGVSQGAAMIGDAVNLAFRLEKLATVKKPVLADRATVELVGTAARFEHFGDHAVHGRAGVESVFWLKAAERR